MSALPTATIIGSHGFVGRHLVQTLRNQGWDLFLPEKQDADIFKRDLGNVFYCAGLTANFRERPFATVNAHVTTLAEILEHASFSNLTYLSSTRVYAESINTNESAPLIVRSQQAGDLYNISKLMGESLCLNAGRNAKVVRLANVYGPNMSPQNFLADVLKNACSTGEVRFRSAPTSSKDYIRVEDVAQLLAKIAVSDDLSGIINLASGTNVTNRQIAEVLETVGVRCYFEDEAPCLFFPPIDVVKISEKFGNVQSDLVKDLPNLFQLYSERL